MLTKLEQILFTRGGGAVQRCHTILHSGSYSNAEHSWGMAMLLLQLYPEDFKELVALVLSHDVPECLVGDAPSTTKESSKKNELEDAINRAFGLPEVGLMSDRDHWILKSLDRLELYLWAAEQLHSGNLWASEVMENLVQLFEQPNCLEPKAKQFFLQVRAHGARPKRYNLLSRIRSHYDV